MVYLNVTNSRETIDSGDASIHYEYIQFQKQKER